MADQPWIAYGKSHMQGTQPMRTLAVITSSPHHHLALMRHNQVDAQLGDWLAGLGADAQGLELNIRRVARP